MNPPWLIPAVLSGIVIALVWRTRGSSSVPTTAPTVMPIITRSGRATPDTEQTPTARTGRCQNDGPCLLSSEPRSVREGARILEYTIPAAAEVLILEEGPEWRSSDGRSGVWRYVQYPAVPRSTDRILRGWTAAPIV